MNRLSIYFLTTVVLLYAVYRVPQFYAAGEIWRASLAVLAVSIILVSANLRIRKISRGIVPEGGPVTDLKPWVIYFVGTFGFLSGVVQIVDGQWPEALFLFAGTAFWVYTTLHMKKMAKVQDFKDENLSGIR